MAAVPSIAPARVLHGQLTATSPDTLRHLLSTFIDAVMSAEADVVCGAPYGMPDPDRVNVRNGYRHRAEAALTRVVATCYLLGVSTRWMEKLVETLGIMRLSKSQVARMAADPLVLKVREGGRVVGVHALLAVGVNAAGHHEVLGLQVTSLEHGAGWASSAT